MKKLLLLKLFALVAAMMCALGASAVEAYACYTSSNTTLTFYYDNQRNNRTGKTYDLNTGNYVPGWITDISTGPEVTKVVFDSSFAGARPTTTFSWFYYTMELESITGMSYLNTSEVTNMDWMFTSCRKLTSLDLSSFNTSNVTNMSGMFFDCSNLRTIYVSGGWTTAAVTNSTNMFYNCSSLVGGQGTPFDANHTDKAYAHIDGGPSNPGYFTAKNTGMRGDVNGDHDVNINDVTTLIDVVLGKDVEYNASAADCNTASGDGTVDINDVTELIARVLTGTW